MLSLLLTILYAAGAIDAEEYEKYSYNNITVNGKAQEGSVQAWKTASSLASDKSNIIKGANAYVPVEDKTTKAKAADALAPKTVTVTANYNLGAPLQTITRSNGDKFFEANKSDIARLENEIKMSIYAIYDDHKIFARYPHLRGLAKNKAFEQMMSAQKVKQR